MIFCENDSPFYTDTSWEKKSWLLPMGWKRQTCKVDTERKSGSIAPGNGIGFNPYALFFASLCRVIAATVPARNIKPTRLGKAISALPILPKCHTIFR